MDMVTNGAGAEADVDMGTERPLPTQAEYVVDGEVEVVRVSRLHSIKAWTLEYKGKLAAVPTRWKVVWVLGIAVWAPLA